jgi:hypothetical protein
LSALQREQCFVAITKEKETLMGMFRRIVTGHSADGRSPGGRGTRLLYRWDAIVELIEGRDRKQQSECTEVLAARQVRRTVRFDAEEATRRLRRLLD